MARRRPLFGFHRVDADLGHLLLLSWLLLLYRSVPLLRHFFFHSMTTAIPSRNSFLFDLGKAIGSVEPASVRY